MAIYNMLYAVELLTDAAVTAAEAILGIAPGIPITGRNPVEVASLLGIPLSTFGFPACPANGVPPVYPVVISREGWPLAPSSDCFPLDNSITCGPFPFTDTVATYDEFCWVGLLRSHELPPPEEPEDPETFPTPPPIPPTCLSALYVCYSQMGDGSVYLPTVGAGSPSLNASGGYMDLSWIDLGVGGGESAVTIDPFDGTPLDLGAAGVEVGLGFGIQFAVNPVGLSSSFTLLWQTNGNIAVQLYGREVAGVRSYEWRRSGLTVMDATPKAVSEGDWDVLGLVFEAYHLVCNVASPDCDAAPFGTSNSTVVRFTDVQTRTQVTQQLGGSTGNTLDDMTFHRGGAAQTGWACAVVAFRRTGLGIPDVDIPASCLLFLGQVCTVTPTDICLAFDPVVCQECYGMDTVSSPQRVRLPQPGETTTTVQLVASGEAPLTVDVFGVAISIGTSSTLFTPPAIRSSPQGFAVPSDPAGLTFPESSDSTALPLRTGGGEGPAVNLSADPECPNPGETGAARDDGIPYTP